MRRNQLLRKQLKSYLLNVLTLGVACFSISYEINGCETTKQGREEYKKKKIEYFKTNFENIEFCFIAMDVKGEKCNINVIIGIKPIITPASACEVINANLHSLMLFFSNIKISVLNNYNLDEYLKFSSKYKLEFNLRIFSKQNIQLAAQFIDYINGYYEDNSLFALELNEYSPLKGNFSVNFDEYSLYNLLSFYLSFNRIAQNKNNIEFLDKNFDKVVEFYRDKFYLQLNLFDHRPCFEKCKLSAINLIKNRDNKIIG